MPEQGKRRRLLISLFISVNTASVNYWMHTGVSPEPAGSWLFLLAVHHHYDTPNFGDLLFLFASFRSLEGMPVKTANNDINYKCTSAASTVISKYHK